MIGDDIKVVRELDYDIVVIGCGVAGTAAASSAAETAKNAGKICESPSSNALITNTEAEILAGRLPICE